MTQPALNVRINHEKITQFLSDLTAKIKGTKDEQIVYDKWSDWHIDNPKQYSVEQITAYCFVVDAMNFCFWPNNTMGGFEYDSMTRNLEKQLIKNPDFFTASRLATVTEAQLREHVFQTNFEFCLVDERARILNEIGDVIQNKFNGQFYSFVEATDFDEQMFVDMVVTHFSGFRDEAIYNGRQVFFYKRAQILCADLIGAFSDIEHDKAFKAPENLTMFADYRVPQILRHLGIFEYTEHLEKMIDSEQELAYSSKEEIEIRAATVMAVEEIKQRIEKDEYLCQKIHYSYEIDWLLWQMGEKALGEMKPHHQVLSIFY